MTRSFIEIPLFTKSWKQIGAGDETMNSLYEEDLEQGLKEAIQYEQAVY